MPGQSQPNKFSFTNIRKSPFFFLFVLLASYTIINYLDRLYREDHKALVYLNILTEAAAGNAGWLYSLAGASHQVLMNPDGAQLYINNAKSVFVGYPCNGLTIMLLFSVFILAVGGSWRKMLWFLPLGWLSIHIVNVLRIFLLMLIYHYRPSWVDFNHKYVFTLVVYSFVFYLFVTWIKKYSDTEAAKEADEVKEE